MTNKEIKEICDYIGMPYLADVYIVRKSEILVKARNRLISEGFDFHHNATSLEVAPRKEVLNFKYFFYSDHENDITKTEEQAILWAIRESK